MQRGRGIILKIVPYSDNASIVRCFTDDRGVLPLFVRHAKKNKQNGHIQTGAFIEFTAQTKTGMMASIRDSKWDRQIPNTPLHPAMLATWLFTIELLHRSLAEEFPLPLLKTRIDNYYAHLLHDAVSVDPCIPLMVISHALGILDLALLNSMFPASVTTDLTALGYSFPTLPSSAGPLAHQELFETELSRFMEHFGISQLESRSLF